MYSYKTDGTSSFKSIYYGKTISILGASYDLALERFNLTENDMWWYKVCSALGMTVNTNNSIAGSLTCGNPSGSTAGCGTRATSLGTLPDVIMVTLGGNDFSSEYGIGEYDGSQSFPTSGDTFREAYAIMLKKIMETYPRAEVYCQTRPYIYETDTPIAFPEKNGNGVLLKTWNEAIEDVAKLFGARVVHMENCGITWFNREHFAADYSSGWSLHPNAYGQSAMANEVIRALDSSCDKKYKLWE